MSPLRQRMIDAMTVRGLSVRTIECYTESISRLCRHYGGVNPARLSPEQKAELAVWIEAGPDPETDGVVRWRRQDLQRRITVPGHGFETARCAGYAAILTSVAASVSRAFCSALI